MPYYFCRLNPPRPSFAADMTDDEQRLMGEHGAYWSGLLAKGRAVVFGLVADPTAPWGMTIVEAGDQDGARELTGGDPAIQADAGFSYDVFEMPNAISR